MLSSVPMGIVRFGHHRRIRARLRAREHNDRCGKVTEGMVIEPDPPATTPAAAASTEIAQPPGKHVPRPGWGR